MSTPTFDPMLPAQNSPLRSTEMRNQLNALKNLCDETAGQLANVAPRPSLVSPLTTTISDPPTQAEVTELRDKINELLAALQG